MCLRWREMTGEIRQYSLRFGPEHLCRAERWEDLTALLTDLEFVEAKCLAGMVPELIRDYQLASRQHPEWRKVTEKELRREQELERWSREVMEAGKRWRAELDRAWQSEDPDLVELPRPFRFPKPPDTSDTVARLLEMHRTETDTALRREPVATLELFRSFVTELVDKLVKQPKATLPLAFNYRASGRLADEAEKLLTTRGAPWFEEHASALRPRLDPVARD